MCARCVECPRYRVTRTSSTRLTPSICEPAVGRAARARSTAASSAPLTANVPATDRAEGQARGRRASLSAAGFGDSPGLACWRQALRRRARSNRVSTGRSEPRPSRHGLGRARQVRCGHGVIMAFDYCSYYTPSVIGEPHLSRPPFAGVIRVASLRNSVALCVWRKAAKRSRHRRARGGCFQLGSGPPL